MAYLFDHAGDTATVSSNLSGLLRHTKNLNTSEKVASSLRNLSKASATFGVVGTAASLVGVLFPGKSSPNYNKLSNELKKQILAENPQVKKNAEEILSGIQKIYTALDHINNDINDLEKTVKASFTKLQQKIDFDTAQNQMFESLSNLDSLKPSVTGILEYANKSMQEGTLSPEDRANLEANRKSLLRKDLVGIYQDMNHVMDNVLGKQSMATNDLTKRVYEQTYGSPPDMVTWVNHIWERLQLGMIAYYAILKLSETGAYLPAEGTYENLNTRLQTVAGNEGDTLDANLMKTGKKLAEYLSVVGDSVLYAPGGWIKGWDLFSNAAASEEIFTRTLKSWQAGLNEDEVQKSLEEYNGIVSKGKNTFECYYECEDKMSGQSSSGATLEVKAIELTWVYSDAMGLCNWYFLVITGGKDDPIHLGAGITKPPQNLRSHQRAYGTRKAVIQVTPNDWVPLNKDKYEGNQYGDLDFLPAGWPNVTMAIKDDLSEIRWSDGTTWTLRTGATWMKGWDLFSNATVFKETFQRKLANWRAGLKEGEEESKLLSQYKGFQQMPIPRGNLFTCYYECDGKMRGQTSTGAALEVEAISFGWHEYEIPIEGGSKKMLFMWEFSAFVREHGASEYRNIGLGKGASRRTGRFDWWPPAQGNSKSVIQTTPDDWAALDKDHENYHFKGKEYSNLDFLPKAWPNVTMEIKDDLSEIRWNDGTIWTLRV